MDLRTQVSDLMLLGLTHYEAKGYLGLVGRQQATPQEVARRTGLPRQRAYDVLASLAERGLVIPVEGAPVRYRARSPERVVEELVALRRTELQEHERLGTGLVARLTPSSSTASPRTHRWTTWRCCATARTPPDGSTGWSWGSARRCSGW